MALARCDCGCGYGMSWRQMAHQNGPLGFRHFNGREPRLLEVVKAKAQTRTVPGRPEGRHAGHPLNWIWFLFQYTAAKTKQ